MTENNTDSLEDRLKEIFLYGQNDSQPQKHPSLSEGDGIQYEKYPICNIGFRKLTPEEYETILKSKNRHFLDFKANL